MISDKEYALVTEIAANNRHTQRTLSMKLGVSLGMTNLLLKRLIRQGYVKVSQLDRRKVRYILTPKGFAEKTKKSYRYTLKNIAMLQEMSKAIRDVIIDEVNKGNKRFFLSGNGELGFLSEIALRGMQASGVTWSRDNSVSSQFDVVLELNPKRTDDYKNGRVINIPEAIAERIAAAG